MDKIPFASSDILIKLNTKLQALKEKDGSKYGKIHIIFMGDFSQLERVTGRVSIILQNKLCNVARLGQLFH
jgi:hypothetical protein